MFAEVFACGLIGAGAPLQGGRVIESAHDILAAAVVLGGTTGPLIFLVDLAVKGIAILLLATVLDVLMRRASSASRHLLWAFALVGVLAAPLLTAFLPGWKLGVPGNVNSVVTVGIEPSPTAVPTTPITSEPREQPAEQRPTRSVPDDAGPASYVPRVPRTPTPVVDAPTQESVVQHSIRPTFHALPAPVNPVPDSAQVTTSNHAPTTLLRIDWAASLVMVWLVGVVVSLMPLLLGYVSIWRLRRRARVINDGPWKSLLNSLAKEMGIGRRVTLLECSASEQPNPHTAESRDDTTAPAFMPMTWGSWRPVVLLPALTSETCGEWPPERRRAVLLHELGHVQRWDCLTQSIARCACALHWFNPLAWRALRHLLSERERACDDLVLRRGAKASSYAQALLDLARRMRSSNSVAAVSMARPSQLEGRLLAVLNPKLNRRPISMRRLTLVASVAAVLLTTLCCLHLTTVPARAEDAKTTPKRRSIFDDDDPGTNVTKPPATKPAATTTPPKPTEPPAAATEPSPTEPADPRPDPPAPEGQPIVNFDLKTVSEHPARITLTPYGKQPLIEAREPNPYWTSVPPVLRNTVIFDKDAGADTGDAGDIHFSVDQAGYVLLACHFGKQGKGGAWEQKRLTQDQFVERGWKVVDNAVLGGKMIRARGEREQVIFWKRVATGEQYDLRCNKYEPPYVILFTRPARPPLAGVPTPSSQFTLWRYEWDGGRKKTWLVKDGTAFQIDHKGTWTQNGARIEVRWGDITDTLHLAGASRMIKGDNTVGTHFSARLLGNERDGAEPPPGVLPQAGGSLKFQQWHYADRDARLMENKRASQGDLDGSWTREGSRIAIKWDNKITDTLNVLPDGLTATGQSSNGTRFDAVLSGSNTDGGKVASVRPADPIENAGTTRSTRRTRLISGPIDGTLLAGGDDQFTMYLNGKLLAEGDWHVKPVPVTLKIGDVLTVKAINTAYVAGFECLCIFEKEKLQLVSEPTEWKAYTPRSTEQWFDPAGIAAAAPAQPGQAKYTDPEMQKFAIADVPCIWGGPSTGNSTCYLTTTVTAESLHPLDTLPPRVPGKPIVAADTGGGMKGTLYASGDDLLTMCINGKIVTQTTLQVTPIPVTLKPGDVITVKADNDAYEEGIACLFVFKEDNLQFATDPSTWKSYAPRDPVMWSDPNGMTDIRPAELGSSGYTDHSMADEILADVPTLWGPKHGHSACYLTVKVTREMFHPLNILPPRKAGVQQPVINEGDGGMRGTLLASGDDKMSMFINGKLAAQNSIEPLPVSVMLKAGDVITVKASNANYEAGFACIFLFNQEQLQLTSEPGVWKLFTPRNPSEWYNPAGITDTRPAVPGQPNYTDPAMGRVVTGKVPCIWGPDLGNSSCYLTAKVTKSMLHPLTAQRVQK